MKFPHSILNVKDGLSSTRLWITTCSRFSFGECRHFLSSSRVWEISARASTAIRLPSSTERGWSLLHISSSVHSPIGNLTPSRLLSICSLYNWQTTRAMSHLLLPILALPAPVQTPWRMARLRVPSLFQMLTRKLYELRCVVICYWERPTLQKLWSLE